MPSFSQVKTEQSNEGKFHIRAPHQSEKEKYERIVSFEVPTGTTVGFSYNGYLKSTKDPAICHNCYFCPEQKYADMNGMYHVWKNTKEGKDFYTIATTHSFDGNIGVSLPLDQQQRKLFVLSTRDVIPQKQQIAAEQKDPLAPNKEEKAKLPTVDTPANKAEVTYPPDDDIILGEIYAKKFQAQREKEKAQELKKQQIEKTTNVKSSFSKFNSDYLRTFNGYSNITYEGLTQSKEELKDVLQVLSKEDLFNNPREIETALVKLHVFKLQRASLLTENYQKRLAGIISELEDVAVYHRGQGNTQHLTAAESRRYVGNGFYYIDNPNPKFEVSYGSLSRSKNEQNRDNLQSALKEANSKESWKDFAEQLRGLIYTQGCKVRYS